MYYQDVISRKIKIHEEESQSETPHSHGQYIGSTYSFSFMKMFSHPCLTELPPFCNASSGKEMAQITLLKRNQSTQHCMW